ncbi:MAG: aldo/keto reductase [Thermoflexus sp.]|uniref:aldo/keto reductase n=1 Tax=Thermoflexus sp. TaxID=1969742 RepID=UPI0033335CA6
MEYRTLGRTGMKVSALCLGTMTFGWTADEATAHRILSAAVDLGINFIDTADIYPYWAPGAWAGLSEEIIGRWRKGRRREDLVIATKVRGPMGPGPNDQGLSRKHLFEAVEGSLRRLGTDYIDLYQVHWPDEETPLEETLRALDDLVRQGKVRYIGASNFPAWLLCKALWISDKHGWARFDSLQPHYNLLHRAEFERELMPLCRDQGLGVIPYSPLAGGFLTGKYRRDAPPPAGSRGAVSEWLNRYLQDERAWAVLGRVEAIARELGKTPAQVALAWLLNHPAVTSPIIGASTVEQLHELVGAVGWRLPEETWQELEALTAWKRD